MNNMKLTAHYTKMADGRVYVTLSVTDPGDYPTSNVFIEGIPPAHPDFRLGKGQEHFCSYIGLAQEAPQWVAVQVAALRRHLEAWRAIELPSTQEFRI